MNSTGKLCYACFSSSLYALYFHSFSILCIPFSHLCLLLSSLQPSHFLPLPLSLLLEILDQLYLIYYTMIMIHYSQYLMLHYYQKKTSLRSVFQLPWPPYWLPQLSGKETKMPNSKQKQHMIYCLSHYKGDTELFTLSLIATTCCVAAYVSHQILTYLL